MLKTQPNYQSFGCRIASLALAVLVALIPGQSASAQLKNGDSEHAVTVDRLLRAYVLHVPANHPHNSALVMVFHGGGGHNTSTEAITRMNSVADEHGFVVAYPQGLFTTWNDGGSNLGQRPTRDDVTFTRQMVDDIARQIPIDKKQVFACGFSNGAMFATRLALEAPDLIAAAAMVEGGLMQKHLEEHPNPKPISILIIAATADPCFPFDGGETTAPKTGQHCGVAVSASDAIEFWRKIDSCRAPAHISEVPHTVQDNITTTYKFWDGSDGFDVAEYIVTNGGHCWPGGIQYFPVDLIGKTTYDFSASEAIWRFFAAHGKH
jgi:polyhydroxybutyrate depolymerase